MFTQEDIASAIDVVKDYFHNEFEACTMTEIYYGGDELSKRKAEYYKGYFAVLVCV